MGRGCLFSALPVAVLQGGVTALATLLHPIMTQTALANLSPERRQVFIDAAIDGKSYQQVADEQGVKIGTVMSRLNRARTQLKRELASYAKERGYVTGSSAGSPSAKLGENVGRIADSGHNGSSEQTVGSNGDTQAAVRHSHATGARTPQQSSKLSGKEI